MRRPLRKLMKRPLKAGSEARDWLSMLLVSRTGNLSGPKCGVPEIPNTEQRLDIGRLVL